MLPKADHQHGPLIEVKGRTPNHQGQPSTGNTISSIQTNTAGCQLRARRAAQVVTEPGRIITVRGPGRCTQCSWHFGTQGHRDGCDRTSGAEAAARYRAGLCIVCGTNKHSAGRPRCNACHGGHGGRSA